MPGMARRCQRPTWLMMTGGEAMADTEKTPATLLDQLAALEPARRRELAKQLRKVAETFAEVPDGRDTAHTLGLLAHLLDSG